MVVPRLSCGPDTTRLSGFTQMPSPFIAAIRQRMIAAELWTEVDVCCDHWYVSDQLFSAGLFWADVLVAQGLAVRQSVEDES